jgi:eukaryotic-like serine/threonine-protein kinase
MTTGYAPGKKIDHYEVIRQLGHGGMSRVYLATDLHDKSKVVLKFLNDDLIGDIAIFERYRREAEIGSRLGRDHPYIQRMLNVQEERSDQYLVMEYIEGKTLRHVLEEHEGQPLDEDMALRIAKQISEALVYCHEHGVYHRDIKPENIMMQANGDVKIIDFGIALLEGARRVTWRGLSGTVGTPDYMAPEQLRGERGAAGSDIYAVGIILYEMLCGRTPFDGENVFAVMNQHVSQDPPSILNYNPHLSPELVTVVMRAIRRDKEKRYKTIGDLLDDLRNLPKVHPVPYHPEEPTINRTGRMAVIATLVILLIFLAVVLFGILVQYLHNMGK